MGYMWCARTVVCFSIFCCCWGVIRLGGCCCLETCLYNGDFFKGFTTPIQIGWTQWTIAGEWLRSMCVDDARYLYGVVAVEMTGAAEGVDRVAAALGRSVGQGCRAARTGGGGIGQIGGNGCSGEREKRWCEERRLLILSTDVCWRCAGGR